MNERSLDHYLVRLHGEAHARETGGATAAGDGNHHYGAKAAREAGPSEETFAQALAAGLAEGSAFAPRLTASGETLARELLRRYRLAERLLSDLLGVGEEALDEAACGMEHVLSPAVTDAICTLLGHPPVCPHGRPIPPGPCCREAWESAPPVVVPLSECAAGARGRISFVGGRGAVGIDRLAENGLVPGAGIRLVRQRPVPVVEIGEITFAIEEELAKEIFVRPERRGG